MTQQDWMAHWIDRVAGMALRGLVLDQDERARGPGSAGGYAMAIPEKVEKLLEQMWLTAQPVVPVGPDQNGKPPAKPQPTPPGTPPGGKPAGTPPAQPRR